MQICPGRPKIITRPLRSRYITQVYGGGGGEHITGAERDLDHIFTGLKEYLDCLSLKAGRHKKQGLGEGTQPKVGREQI